MLFSIIYDINLGGSIKETIKKRSENEEYLVSYRPHPRLSVHFGKRNSSWTARVQQRQEGEEGIPDAGVRLSACQRSRVCGGG